VVEAKRNIGAESAPKSSRLGELRSKKQIPTSSSPSIEPLDGSDGCSVANWNVRATAGSRANPSEWRLSSKSQKRRETMFRHVEEFAAPKRISEEVVRGVLSMLGGIIVMGLLVLIITLSG
jgi:hypothetical protein